LESTVVLVQAATPHIKDNAKKNLFFNSITDNIGIGKTKKPAKYFAGFLLGENVLI